MLSDRQWDDEDVADDMSSLSLQSRAAGRSSQEEDGVVFYDQAEPPAEVLEQCPMAEPLDGRLLVTELVADRVRSWVVFRVAHLSRWTPCELTDARGVNVPALVAIVASRAFDQEIGLQRARDTPWDELPQALKKCTVTAALGVEADMTPYGFEHRGGKWVYSLVSGLKRDAPVRAGSVTQGRRKYDVVRKRVTAMRARDFDDTAAYGHRIVSEPGMWKIAHDRKTGQVVGYLAPSSASARSLSPDARCALVSASDGDSEPEECDDSDNEPEDE